MSVNVGHYSPGPQLGKPQMKGKGNGISYPIKLSISKLPLEISCILVLEHLSTLERKKRDDFFFSCFWVIRSLEDSTMWWKSRPGFFKKQQKNWLCKIVYKRKNSVINLCFKFQLYCLSAEWPWANYFSSLSLFSLSLCMMNNSDTMYKGLIPNKC